MIGDHLSRNTQTGELQDDGGKPSAGTNPSIAAIEDSSNEVSHYRGRELLVSSSVAADWNLAAFAFAWCFARPKCEWWLPKRQPFTLCSSGPHFVLAYR
jgi:hypothetical protein